MEINNINIQELTNVEKQYELLEIKNLFANHQLILAKTAARLDQIEKCTINNHAISSINLSFIMHYLKRAALLLQNKDPVYSFDENMSIDCYQFEIENSIEDIKDLITESALKLEGINYHINFNNLIFIIFKFRE